MTGPEYMELMEQIRKNHQHILDEIKNLSGLLSQATAPTREFRSEVSNLLKEARFFKSRSERWESKFKKLKNYHQGTMRKLKKPKKPKKSNKGAA